MWNFHYLIWFKKKLLSPWLINIDDGGNKFDHSMTFLWENKVNLITTNKNYHLTEMFRIEILIGKILLNFDQNRLHSITLIKCFQLKCRLKCLFFFNDSFLSTNLKPIKSKKKWKKKCCKKKNKLFVQYHLSIKSNQFCNSMA